MVRLNYFPHLVNMLALALLCITGQYPLLAFSPDISTPDTTKALTSASSVSTGRAISIPVVDSSEAVVQRQLAAYNARNIDAFLNTYADSIRIYDYPNTLLMDGKDDLRKRYARLFNDTPNLHAEIKKRIVLGNKVIDHEHVRFGENYIDVIAIYEVGGDKIARVTFIR